jgi:hypothetical protein
MQGVEQEACQTRESADFQQILEKPRGQGHGFSAIVARLLGYFAK